MINHTRPTSTTPFTQSAGSSLNQLQVLKRSDSSSSVGSNRFARLSAKYGLEKPIDHEVSRLSSEGTEKLLYTPSYVCNICLARFFNLDDLIIHAHMAH